MLCFMGSNMGAAKGLNSCVYYTIGICIGVDVFVEGKHVHGLVHPVGGHTPVRRHLDDSYDGNCIYHGDCLEGMAVGPAIDTHWQMKGYELPFDHPAWAIEACYIEINNNRPEIRSIV